MTVKTIMVAVNWKVCHDRADLIGTNLVRSGFHRSPPWWLQMLCCLHWCLKSLGNHFNIDPISLDIVLQFKFYWKFIILQFDQWQPDHYKYLHMLWQHSCVSCAKILLWSLDYNLDESKLKFPSNLNYGRETIREMEACMGIPVMEVLIALVCATDPEGYG